MQTDSPPVSEAQMNFDITDGGIKPPSFKDKLLNSVSIAPEDKEDDLPLNRDDVSIGLNGNIPTVDFASHIIQTLNKKMGLAVVVKLLGRKIGYRLLRSQFQKIWKPASQIKLIDLHDDYFLVRFHDDLDYQNSLLTGPWVIFGHYLAVQPWSPAFKPQTHVINQVMGWIRLPKLPVRYYHKSVIRAIGSAFGEVIKVDYNTDSGYRAKFARIAVMIDLIKPLTSKIIVDGELIFVEYEGLPSICFNCGRYGHLQQACPLNQIVTAEGQPDATMAPEPIVAPEVRETSQYGAWMQVQRRRRAIVRGDKPSAQYGSNKVASVSRYEILSGMPDEEHPLVYDQAKEDFDPNANSLARGTESKDHKKTSTGTKQKATTIQSTNQKATTSQSTKQKATTIQSTNQDSIFNSKHYVASKATTILDPNYNVAIQVNDSRLPPRKNKELARTPNLSQGMDPLSKSRGLKLASGVTIHNLGAKPNPNLAEPSVRIMKQLARDIQAEVGASADAMFEEGVAPYLPTNV
ncbi:hypothetical protein K1719_037524 [Acacia pycnantha]|nr:hypothetical protein K1719_037524 [Acacia pycnantha]